jgi:hypothetical protein
MMTTVTECRECRAGRMQAVSCYIGWFCPSHGIQRLDVSAILDALEQARADLARKDAALERALAFHDRYCDRVGAADGWAHAVHAALRAALEAK